MEQLEQLYHLYDAYEETAKEVRSKASRYAGAFGLGEDPRKHGCHEHFFEDVGKWSRNFIDSDPSEEEVIQAAWWMLKAADTRRNTDVFGYLYALHGYVKDMIPLLPQEESHALLQWYDKTYPERERLPVHQEVYRLLQRQAGVNPVLRRGLFSFFRKR